MGWQKRNGDKKRRAKKAKYNHSNKVAKRLVDDYCRKEGSL